LTFAAKSYPFVALKGHHLRPTVLFLAPFLAMPHPALAQITSAPTGQQSPAAAGTPATAPDITPKRETAEETVKALLDLARKERERRRAAEEAKRKAEAERATAAAEAEAAALARAEAEKAAAAATTSKADVPVGYTKPKDVVAVSPSRSRSDINMPPAKSTPVEPPATDVIVPAPAPPSAEAETAVEAVKAVVDEPVDITPPMPPPESGGFGWLWLLLAGLGLAVAAFLAKSLLWPAVRLGIEFDIGASRMTAKAGAMFEPPEATFEIKFETGEAKAPAGLTILGVAQ
jgi:hypothetical protein